VNTDTRTISDITLNEEYEKLHRVFGWEKEDFLKCNLNALRAAFIPQETREELIARLKEGYQ
jgi:adenosine deaminase